MRYFFYNSFTLGSGYKYAELKDNVICSTDIPTDIDCDFCNGGCQLVVRKTNAGTSILVLKGILYDNKQKRFDEQGRKVYINFAIEAPISEHSKLNNIFFAMIAEWNNLCRYLGESVKIPYHIGTYGYGIEQSHVESLTNYLSIYDTQKIKEEIGIDLNNKDVIVLKSANYTYYEELATDLYKSKDQTFRGNFIQKNIISGDTFKELTKRSSLDTYDDFMQKINDCSGSSKENQIEPELKDESTNTNELQELITEENESPITNENNNNSIEKKNKENEKIIEFHNLYVKAYNILKPYSKFILGFICGLLIGYLIWK